MPVAVVLILLVFGSVAFHVFSPWWLTPIASNWERIDDALNITLWICGFVFIAVNLFIALAIIRYRHRHGSRAEYEPENASLEKHLTLWTAAGIALMLAPGLVAWHAFVKIPDDAATVEALGQQWQWSFRFPGRDGVLGTANAQHMTADNPFGLNPHDPYARDDILIEGNELHLPVGRSVKFLLRSNDVLHDFYVPQFRAKMDLVPGMITYFWLKPTRLGNYEILCAELCGTGHYAMRGSVVISNPNTFQAWLNEQPTFAQLMAEAGKQIAVAEPSVANRSARPIQVAQAVQSTSVTSGGQ